MTQTLTLYLTSFSSTSLYCSDFYFLTHRPFGTWRDPCCESGRFILPPHAVKLQPPPTSYLHPSPDWCICSSPLMAFVLLGPQRKSLLGFKASSFLFYKEQKQNSVNLPLFVYYLWLTLLYLRKGRDHEVCLVTIPSAVDNGCCDHPLPPLLRYWSLGLCLSQCTFAVQQSWQNPNYMSPSTGCKTKLHVSCSLQ